MFRLFELTPGTTAPTLTEALDWYLPDDVLQVRALFDRGVASGVPWEHDARVRLPSGRIVWHHGIGTPFCTADGIVTRISGTTQNITARKEAELRLLEIHAQACVQDKLATLGQLAAGIAHEINNPASFIRSNLGTMEKYFGRIQTFLDMQREVIAGNAPAPLQEHLDAARQQGKVDFIVGDITALLQESREGVDRIRNTVCDVMKFARKGDEARTELDLHACLESSVAIAWNEIRAVAELVREFGDLPAVVGNSQQLSQVFVNLLVNAAHAISGSGTIRVRTWLDGSWVCVAVADSGCGIPDDLREKIFEPFFTTKEPGRGTGLGLAISRDIIVRHGGRIEVDSSPGSGTSFTVMIPHTDVLP
jgi:two-component system NtrC family sensor kinase